MGDLASASVVAAASYSGSRDLQWPHHGCEKEEERKEKDGGVRVESVLLSVLPRSPLSPSSLHRTLTA
jgi:hypothetical protein